MVNYMFISWKSHRHIGHLQYMIDHSHGEKPQSCRETSPTITLINQHTSLENSAEVRWHRAVSSRDFEPSSPSKLSLSSDPPCQLVYTMLQSFSVHGQPPACQFSWSILNTQVWMLKLKPAYVGGQNSLSFWLTIPFVDIDPNKNDADPVI